MSNKKEEILRVSNLKQYFKHGSGKNKIIVKAVDGISFSIYKGEVFSLVGESGCGKTTTGRTIIKLLPSTGGEVHFHGTRIISDVKQGKKTYKIIKRKLKATKKEKTASLKEQLEAEKISKDQFDLEVQTINETYLNEMLEARETLTQEKRDRKFEHYIDPVAKKESQQFNENSKEYIEITNNYLALNKDIQVEISDLTNNVLNVASSDKKQIAEAKRKISSLNKEMKLNLVRTKQDITRYKYNLVNKNRLLMRRMQMIFQDPIASLNPRMTVKEIIAEGMRINGVKNEAIIEQSVKDALITVGLVPEHAGRYPHEFSGGQRQRIGIARTLVVEPSFIIADEPISALDVSIRAQVINLLNDLREQKGITILFIAHDLSVVKYFSDRVAVMYFGKIVEIGEKNKMFDNPFHPYTLSLMSSIPLPDPAYEKLRGELKRYNPATEHDYSVEQPTLREVEPDHMVLCNTEEFNRYQAQLKK